MSPDKWRYVRPNQPPLFIGSNVALAVPEQWVPTQLGGRAVALEYKLPLNFGLAQP